ncbi:AbrB/MazE/SpoVT family DNA-binding domain-containing protein [Candidatus Pacearchaeota archaeon]|nr:AbrB/MazE/SpoVT family DNA-binding domain-containing protein [Candidatus Pacearchaeota archaeon]
MGITKKELMGIIRIQSEVEKYSIISDDGKNLLIRIPKEIKEVLEIKKGSKIKWLIDKENKLKIELINE